MKAFFIENRDTILSILGGIIVFIRGLVQFFYKKKHEIKIQGLKNDLEFEKHQKIINSKKFREGYEDFIHTLVNQIGQNKKEMTEVDKKIMRFIQVCLLFAGPDTIKSFGKYRKESEMKNTKDILIYMEELIVKMRDDLGVSNRGLEKFDILQMFFVGDIKKALYKKVIEENKNQLKEDLSEEILQEYYEDQIGQDYLQAKKDGDLQ